MPTPQQVLKAIDDFELAARWCVASGKIDAEYWHMDRAYYDGRYPDTVVVEWLEMDPLLRSRWAKPERVAWPVHLDELEIDCDPVYIALCRWQHEQAMGRV